MSLPVPGIEVTRGDTALVDTAEAVKRIAAVGVGVNVDDKQSNLVTNS